MLTECPTCRTVFRVTAAILKMGHGQVRCGKCRMQFDAIECMLDDEEQAELESPKPESAAPQPPPPAFEPTYAEEVTMEGSRIEISGTYRIPDERLGQEQVVQEHVVIDRGDLPSIANDDVDDEAEDTEAADAEIVLEGASLADPAEADADSDEEAPVAAQEAPPVPKRWRRTLANLTHREPRPEIHAELHALTQRERPRRLRSGVWTTLCALLIFAFVAQLVHHNRDALVRHPRLGDAVARVYRALGLSPIPNWDLAAYQWDIYKVSVDPNIPDALRVIGSVANNAPFAQPYPLGRLSLRDRWEMPVGVRAFEPYEYLPSPELADRLMAPKQRSNIEVVIVDPGPDAVGYLIHACLERERGIICADDLRSR